MAETFAAFLRGINVNGNKIKMDDLKEAFAEMGFDNVHTVLNTGNVIFTADQSAPELKLLIENGLKVTFGYDSPVYLRSISELKALQGITYTLSVSEGCHLYLLLCDNNALPTELDALFATTPHSENERFHPAAGDAFWIVPKGETLSSPFGAKVLGAKRYQNRLTSRNWNTIEKVLALM